VLKPNAGSPSIYYVHADHLSTPREVSDGSSTTVWVWDTQTFGSNEPNQDPDGDGSIFTFNLRFPGQYADTETGKAYNYFRDYDSRVGRYLESDPIGLAGGIHTYTYVLGNPIALVDQMGLQQQSVPICRALKPGETANTPPGNSGHLKCDDEVPGFTLKNYRTYGCSKLKECAEIHETRHKDDCGADACKGNQGKDVTMIFLTSSDHMTSENNAFNDELKCLMPNPYNHATDANCYNVCEDRANDIKKRLLPCVARGDYNHTPDCMDQRPTK
jgi:RHS repeat-associated protein